MEEEQEEKYLTHEGYLRHSLTHLLRECELIRKLSQGRNILLNRVTNELEITCNHALNELRERPSRLTKSEWKEHLKEWERPK